MPSTALVRSPRFRPAECNLRDVLLVLLIFSLSGCTDSPGRFGESGEATPAQPSPADDAKAEEPLAPARRDWAVVVHGGLSAADAEDADTKTVKLRELADMGAQRLADGQAALQVVSELIAELEQHPSFNAGRGSTFNRRGVHEMSAALMDGRTRAFGAVGGLRNIRSPIAAARGALETQQGGQLLGETADSLARSLALPRAPQDSFTTSGRFEAWRGFRREARRLAQEGQRHAPTVDPVGVIALDSFGNLAAGASFGGFTDAEPEQPLAVTTIGAGVYADNRSAAVLALGPDDRLLSCQFPALLVNQLQRAAPEPSDRLSAAIEHCGGTGPLALLAIDSRGRTAILVADGASPLLYAAREADLAESSANPPTPASVRSRARSAD